MKSNKKHLIIASSVVIATVAAPSVFADAASEISTAITSGQALVGMIAPGVIGIAAIMLGVSIAVSWLKK